MTAPAGQPLDALPPDAPATVEDVRGTRRWTWVAFAWAIAASAIAVIALIQAGNNNNDRTTTTTQGVSPQQFQAYEKQTNDRLDALSRRVNNTAASADVQKLDKRLTQAENDASSAKNNASKANSNITQLQSDVKDLQKRVNNLEQQQQNQNGGTTTTP